MKILYVAGEALPYASTGGLADVIGSLPIAVKKELNKNGDIRVVIPFYLTVKNKFLKDVAKDNAPFLTCLGEMSVSLSWRQQKCAVWTLVSGGVRFYFLENDYYFARTKLYGEFDDAERFAFFGKAVLALMDKVEFYPDILHANDWQSAPAVLYIKRKADLAPDLAKCKILYTIHNIAYQGVYDFGLLQDVFELSEADRSVVDYNGNINLTKGAIVVADRVSTVSQRYSREILTEHYACGLTPILHMAQDKLSGIINGIDTDYYNSEQDPEIPYNFTKKNMKGKRICKATLQKECDFPQNPDTPVIAMVSRLDAIKGFDLVQRILEDFVVKNDVQIVLLGTQGNGKHDLEEYFTNLAAKYPEKVCAMIKFDKALSKRIYAGADMFLMPSKSEPCGLAQMIASRYGTVPIVRATGGLADTIHSYDNVSGEGNGFVFSEYRSDDMRSAMENAMQIYKNAPQWEHLIQNVMSVDFSWSASAKTYINLYTSMIEA